MKKRKICVVTGSRAEYGQMYWLLKEIQADASLCLQLVVTGSHLASQFGKTINAIRRDGFSIDAVVDLKLRDNSPLGVTASMGRGLIGFGRALRRLKPDLMVVFGDRYEILAATVAAMLARIPIAHIHGGEITEGALDEGIRHSITKMSQLHFVTARTYRRRVIQLGEDPKRVFCFGAPALDVAAKTHPRALAELRELLGPFLRSPIFLVTYHPATLDKRDPKTLVGYLLKALDAFPDAAIVFTKANADPGSETLNRIIEDYTKQHPRRTILIASLGQTNYLSLLRHADAVIGNSSSGILEAPYFHIPSVNVGNRQQGRLKPASVIDCKDSSDAIRAAIKKALSPGFRRRAARAKNIFGRGGNASKKIKDVLKRVRLDGILMKPFYDLPVSSRTKR